MQTRRRFLLSGVAGVGAPAIPPCAEPGAKERTIFEPKMISAGNNRPSVNLRADRLIEICVALHRRRMMASIEQESGGSPDEFRRKLDSLIQAELVKKSSGRQYLPTFLVVTLEDGKWMAPVARVVEETGRLVAENIPRIRAQAELIPGIRRTGFTRAAFLILSNVLLDNWQIRNVEDQFLKAERPLRNGSRYYLALFEKPAQQRSEAFGIYGNALGTIEGIHLGVYGKQRYDGSTLTSIPEEQYRRLFGVPPQADLQAEALELFNRVAALARTGADHLSPRQRSGLCKLGLLENGELRVTVLNSEEADSLGEVAALFTPSLLAVLERHRAQLESTYERSPYKEEVSFNEFFMWWYHFFYTATTDWLAQQRLLEIPASGNTTYLITSHRPG